MYGDWTNKQESHNCIHVGGLTKRKQKAEEVLNTLLLYDISILPSWSVSKIAIFSIVYLNDFTMITPISKFWMYVIYTSNFCNYTNLIHTSFWTSWWHLSWVKEIKERKKNLWKEKSKEVGRNEFDGAHSNCHSSGHKSKCEALFSFYLQKKKSILQQK